MPEMPFVGDHAGRLRGLSALFAKAELLAAELPPARADSLVASAFEHSHADFLVALAAVWRVGHTFVLPQDARRQSVGPMLRLPEVLAFVHDTGAGSGVCVPDRSWQTESLGSRSIEPWPLPGSLCRCESDGMGSVRVVRSDAESLRSQVERFVSGRFLGAQDRLLVTYAPGHPAALVPGLLGPIWSGCSVLSAVGLSTPEVLARMQEHAATHLLTSPDRLRELARCPAGSLRPLQRLFTLSKPDPHTRGRLAEAHGLEVTRLDHGGGNGELPDPPFWAQLCARPDVEDIAVARVLPPAEPTARWFVLVSGRALPRAELAALVSRECPGEPTPELSTLDRLPRDVNGQLPAAAVLHACGRAGDGRQPNRSIQWEEPVLADGLWRCSVHVPIDFAGFEGHFSEYPVMSGAVQLHDVVLPALRTASGCAVRVEEFGELKFLARIQPGSTIDVQVRIDSGGRSAAFVLQVCGVRCTTGKAVWSQS